MTGVFCTWCKWEAPHIVDLKTMNDAYGRIYSERNGMWVVLKRKNLRRGLWPCRDCLGQYCTLCWESMSVTPSQWRCRDCEVKSVRACPQWDQSIHLWGKETKQALLALLTVDAHYQHMGKQHLGRRALIQLFFTYLVQNRTPRALPRNELVQPCAWNQGSLVWEK